MEQGPRYTPAQVKNEINKPVLNTGEKITNPQEKGLKAKDTEKQDNSIFRQIQEPMTRRNFLKISAKAAIGLTTGYVVNKELDSLTAEYRKEKTSDNGMESKDLQTSTELLEKIAEYPEMIEKSEKQTLDEFANDLSKKDFDNLIIGELHGFGPTLEKAAYFLEELIKKGKKISAICLEGVSYTDPRHVEIIKKINTKEVPLEELSEIVGPIELIKLAKKYSIEIIGLEKGAPGTYRSGEYGRFREMSERMGEISKEKAKEGIVVADVGQGHVTADSWEKFNLLKQLAGESDYFPSKEEALENNYTIKEYLEKIKMKPVAIQIEDWEKLTSKVDSSFVSGSDRLSPNDKKTFYDRANNKWQSYRLKEKEDFVVSYPKAKENTYSMIIPSEIPDRPPKLSEKMGNN